MKPNSDEVSSSSEEGTTSKSQAVAKDRESIENSLENEIVKDKEVGKIGAPEKYQKH